MLRGTACRAAAGRDATDCGATGRTVVCHGAVGRYAAWCGGLAEPMVTGNGLTCNGTIERAPAWSSITGKDAAGRTPKGFGNTCGGGICATCE